MRVSVIILAVEIVLLCSCGSGSGSYEPSESQTGFTGPSGSIVALQLSNGEILNALSVQSTHNANSLEFVLVNSASIPLSDVDAVTTTGFNSSTASQALDANVYCMARELSQAQWNALATATGQTIYMDMWNDVVSSTSFGTPTADEPAWGISKDAIDAVLAAWNANNYFQLRLPTNKEWEFICRGASSTATRFSWGDELVPGNHAQVAESSSSGLRAVSDGTANALGFVNMHGNVWEWTDEGVLRGGSWSDSVTSASSGNVMQMNNDVAYALAGLRLIVEAP